MAVISNRATTVIAAATATLLASYTLWINHSPPQKRQRLRKKLPPNLTTWRLPDDDREGEDSEEQIWVDFDEILRHEGYSQWMHTFQSTLGSPGLTHGLSSGFVYAIPGRTEMNGIGHIGTLRRYDGRNPLVRCARTRNGRDVVIRVIVVGSEGHDHLKILKRLAVGENSLLSNNHTLPMFAEFHFEDITFGVFPMVGAGLQEAYNSWPQNSVGDIIDMLMQMLEALVFIHGMKIAHRDAFRDNYLIQWHPESMLTTKISPSRPRVYLADFEVAVEFPPECPADECLVTTFPFGESLRGYARKVAPEWVLQSGQPYNPFKLDVWQLGHSFSDFKSTIAPIDEILVAMTDADSVHRLSAQEALDRFQTAVYSIPPELLLIAPSKIEH